MTIYKEILLDHSRHPRNYGDLESMGIVRRGLNPLCGDEVEVGVSIDGDRLTRVRFRGRACAICVASASIMTQMAAGRRLAETLEMIDRVHRWLGQDDGANVAIPDQLQPLSAVRGAPARRSCVLLAWDALAAAVSGRGDTI